MSNPDDISVSDWTRRWWEVLPSAYREADAAQLATSGRSASLAPDPHYLTGDGEDWTRTIVSETPEQTVSQMRRMFFGAAAMTPLYVQAWWDMPKAEQASVSIRVQALTGSVLASWESGKLPAGPGRRTISVPAPVPSPFTITVRITRTNTDPDDKYELSELLVSDQENERDHLPGAADVPPTHPLLRFMDGIGSICGRVRNLSDQMWSGEMMSPATVPDNAIHWLAQLAGLPKGVRNQSPEKMRDLLLQMESSGRPPVGTRTALTDVARQYLQNNRQVMVIPDPRAQHTLLILVAATDIPPQGLDWVKQQVRNSGAVPAGHALTTMIAESTWDAWLKAAGPTWQDLQNNARTWNEADSLGIFDGIPVID